MCWVVLKTIRVSCQRRPRSVTTSLPPLENSSTRRQHAWACCKALQRCVLKTISWYFFEIWQPAVGQSAINTCMIPMPFHDLSIWDFNSIFSSTAFAGGTAGVSGYYRCTDIDSPCLSVSTALCSFVLEIHIFPSASVSSYEFWFGILVCSQTSYYPFEDINQIWTANLWSSFHTIFLATHWKPTVECERILTSFFLSLLANWKPPKSLHFLVYKSNLIAVNFGDLSFHHPYSFYRHVFVCCYLVELPLNFFNRYSYSGVSMCASSLLSPCAKKALLVNLSLANLLQSAACGVLVDNDHRDCKPHWCTKSLESLE
jgi:hypothetical protein